MAWVAVMGPCWSCGRIFSFSPTKVPSIVVDGVREPLCASCVDRANRLRPAEGLDPIVPLPGAYEPDETP